MSCAALNPGDIVDFADIDRVRDKLGKIVAASGGFDPLHPGHASYLVEAKKLGGTLVVIVNGDSFLRDKKGRPFQDVTTRCQIVSFVRGVDYVVPFEIENDPTVCEALRRLRPHVFVKGGDRSAPELVPEYAVCKELGIEIVFDVGAPKKWSSRNFLKDWGEFWASAHPSR